MKNKLFKFVNYSALATALFPCASVASCGMISKMPKVRWVEKRSCASHSIIKDSDNIPYYMTDIEAPLTVTLFNGSEVPYLDVDEYVKNNMQFKDVFGDECHNYSSITENGKTIITNTYNNATCTIDYYGQKIIYSDYDNYANHDLDTPNPMASGYGGGQNCIIEVVNTYTPGAEYVIDLTKYNIPIYYYDHHGYIPFEMFRNLISPDSDYGHYFYNGVGFYEISNNNNVETLNLYQDPLESATILTPEYMEYTYNLLAVTIDTRFGLDYRPSRVNPGTIVEYFPNGAYEKLAPYHDALVSLNPDVSNAATKQFFNDCCDDGGHSGYTGLNLLSKHLIDTGFGPELSYRQVIKPFMKAARDDSGFTFDEGVEHKIDLIDSDSDEVQDTAWVTFDGFDSPSMPVTQEMYNNITDDLSSEYAYQKSTIATTMYLQKMVNNDTDTRNINKIIIDVSANGGGTVWDEHVLASYLCGRTNRCEPQSSTRLGGTTHALTNIHTGAFGKYTLYADINMDGIYDEKDYIPEGVQLYCVISPGSFSCGNALPCDLAATSNCKFIGSTTGGGACYVESWDQLGLGNCIRWSSVMHMLLPDSTISNKKSVEGGVSAYYCPIECTPENVHYYYDRDFILHYISEHP